MRKQNKNKKIVLTIFLVFGVLGLLFFSFGSKDKFGSILGVATSPWTQTDWSGGVASGTVDTTVSTYSQINQLDSTTSVGNVKLQEAAGWSPTYSDFLYRKEILIDNTDSKLGVTSENLTDFPVMVKLQSGVNFNYSKAKNQGEDIRFSDSDGTALKYEIEEWSSGGNSYLWVKISSIDQNSGSDKIYMYYGNTAANDDQNPADVWSNNYAMVQHLDDETNSTILGSTGNTYAGSKKASNAPQQVTGKIGGAQYFGGSDYISLGNILSPGSNNFTVEVWFNRPAGGAVTGSIIYNKENIWEASAGSNYLRYAWLPHWSWDGGNSFNYANDEWVKSTITYDKSAQRSYKNSALVYSRSQSGNMGSQSTILQIGARGNTGHSSFFTGNIDEMRVSFVKRSDAWIAASYHSDNDTFLSYNSEEQKYPDSGFIVSNILDTGVAMDWGQIDYSSSGSGSVIIKVRTDTNDDMSTASSWNTCTNISSGVDLSFDNCVNDSDRYLQYYVNLSPSGAITPIFEDISIEFSPSDQIVPDVNATNLQISGISDGDWINYEPTINWVAGSDNVGGNGLAGYCLAIDEANPGSSTLLDPINSGGVLNGFDDGISLTNCPFIYDGDIFDMSLVSGLDLISGKQYYISIKAIDLAGNIWTGPANEYQDLISFKYDNENPLPPAYISTPSSFLSTKDVIVTWPSSGDGVASDLHSGLAGLQYRIGELGVWYGDLHNGNEDISDVLVNDGSYITDETYDYPVLNEGNNFIYFRAIDNVGNVTDQNFYLKAPIKINTIAPSQIKNLSVLPSDSEVNLYSFDWDQPESFIGQASGITYCYSVNSLPNTNTCTYTQKGITQLNPDAFATQPGNNTMYIVAKDEAGNINFETYDTVSFSYSGSAPGIISGLDVSDISDKATSNWKLVLSWNKPVNIGAGISYYEIYRSENTTSCSSGSGIAGFEKIGSSNSTSFIDPNLSQINYYYCIKACDNANNCGAVSATVNETPTGKFTSPAELIAAPEVVNVTARKAVIEWFTVRESDSRIQFGVNKGEYLDEEVANSAQVTGHTITLSNLEPDTNYYYRARWADEDGNIGVSEEKIFKTNPPPTVSNVSVTSIGLYSANVNFSIKDAREALLLYGATSAYGGSVSISTSLEEQSYTIPLNDLSENTIFNIKFELEDVDGNNYDTSVNFQFKTKPIPRISNLEVQEVRETAQPTVNIQWLSNIETTALLNYSPVSNPNQNRDKIVDELMTEHDINISDLLANTLYNLTVRLIDDSGNESEQYSYQFSTAADSRPPDIADIKIDTRVSSSAEFLSTDASSQLIISWNTDELATSQIEYGEGTTGVFTQKTQLDNELGFNHVVVLPNLRPGSIYHLRIVTTDEAGNTSYSKNIISISANKSDSSIELILGRLADIFTFLR